MTLPLARQSVSALLSSVALCFALFSALPAKALTAQTITGFAPATPVLFSGGTFALTATGGGSGNPVVFTSTTASICTVAGSTVTKVGLGTCTLRANQAGNATFSAAPQVTKSVVINKGTQTITFATLAAKSFVMAPFTISATASSGLAVAFTSTTTTVCTVSGTSVTLVALGTCTIAANQAGNTNYNAATRVTRSFTVSKGTQTITFAALAGKGFGTAPFTVSATASSNLAVTFSSTTTPVCTVSGSTVTIVALGTCTIATNQAGNVNFNAAAQVTQSFTVSKGTQTITFAALTGKALGSAPFAASATASSGLAVVLTSTTTPVCTVAGSTVTLVTTGTCTIAANQAGNSNYNAATQVTRSFTVSSAALTAQTITFEALAGKGFGSTPFTVSATASSGLAVAFTSTTTAICAVSGATVTIVALGTCTIAANQAGNATYSAAPQVTQSFTVSKGAQTITFAALGGKTFGSAPFTVSATASSGLAVAFTSTTTPVCTVSGSTVTLVTTGTCTIAANQGGNTNYNAATQVTRSFTVSTTALTAQTITFAAIAGKTLGTAPFAISASASSGLAVAFSSTTTSVCTISGSTITLITMGTCTIAANQPGNATYSAAPQITQSFGVSNSISTIFDSPLAVGANHNCALTTGGGAKCWGENESGQLGDGTTVSKATPVDVVGLTSGVAALSAGPSHTCAITTAGGVKCWGGANRLGNGSSAGSNVPVDVVGLSSGVVAVSAGSLHTCVVTNVGGVKCWGDNSSSQLGDGTTNSQNAPVAVTGFASGATDVRAGGAHTCALTDGGGVKCWGSNYYGTLGQGSTSPSTSGTPLDVYFSGIRGVEAGSDHSCVLRGASAVACVGANYYGQIGVSAALLNFRSFPQDVAEITEALDTLAAGYSSSCVVTAAGRLKCWGSIVNSGVPVDVPPFISGVTDVGIGQAHVCVVIAGGGVRCWGSNASGQLGNNSPTGVNSTGSGVPVTVVGFSGASGIAQALTFVSPQTLNGTNVNLVATASSGLTPVFSSSTPSVCTVAGAALTILTQGTCTVLVNQPGDGNFAAASQISQTFTINASLQAINFAALPDRSVDTGSVALDATASSGLRVVYSTTTPSVCSVTDAATTLVAIGTCTITANQPGNVAFAAAPPVSRSFLVTVGSQRIMFGLLANVALGSAAPPFSAAATSALSVTYASLTPLVCTVSGNTVTTLAVGGCAVTAIQNGNASFTAARPVTQSFEIVAVNTTASPLSLTTGAEHTCALTAAGGAKCWGANRFGKLGDGTEIDRSAPVDVIGLTSSVVAVKAGGSHSCAITNGGGVKCWGYNINGQLGNGTSTQQSSPVDVVGLSRGVVDLTLGSSHSCALLNDATVRCWGRNENQELADGTRINRSTPVQVIGLPTNVVALRAGGFHTCALTAFGGVVCWGANSSGQLGNGTTYDFGVAPVAIAGMGAGVTTVGSGRDFTCALADVGSVGCVGNNSSNQLGDGTGVSRLIPTVVTGFSSGAVGLTAGNRFSCAITGAWGLKCWGYLSYLSPAADLSYPVPTDIIGLTSNVVQASIGSDHVCAITAQATVSCFGSNTNGQLGNGTRTSSISPVVVTGFPASMMLMQSIQFAPIPDQTVSSPAFPLKAVASSGLPVSFASLTPSVCTVSTNVVSPVGVGACVIAASQLGNATYRPAFQSTRSFAITAAGTSPQVITGFSPTTPATFVPNSTFILSAASGASGNPVVFTSTTPAVCALTGGIVTMLTVGTCSLTANQAGNATFAAAPQATANVVIAKANQTITFAVITDKTIPDSPVTVSATSSSGLALVFTSTTTPICTVIGTVVTLVSSGVCTIAANQAGNVSYNAAPQVSQTFNVLNIAQSITFLALIDRAVGETFVVDAASSIGLPVVFSSTTSTVCSVSGTTVVPNAVGTCTIAANQPGNVTYGPAAQVTRSFAVRPLQTISGFTPPASVVLVAGATVTLSATASSGQTVTFASLTTEVCTVTGSVVTFVGTGACEIQAIQAGNASFAPATAYATILVVPTGQPAVAPVLLTGDLIAALRTDAYLSRLVLGSASAVSNVTIAGLPPGISYVWNGKSNIELSGTPTAAGIFNASISATNATGTATLPIKLTVVEPLSNVTSVGTAGDGTKRVSCAVSNGGVMCWGTGHLGVPAGSPGSFVPELVIPVNSGATAVSVGPQHACAIVNGGLDCWGAYTLSLSNSNISVVSSTPVTVIAQRSGVTAVSAGDQHTCAVTNGSLTCFGSNVGHRIGDVDTTFSNDSVSRYYSRFTISKGVTDVAAGSAHTCVIINGGVKCWGSNQFSQLGVAQSLTLPQSPPNTADAPVDTIAALSGVTAISASGNNTCAVVNGGAVCWGDNRAGQLGVGNTAFRELPVQVLPAGSGVTSVSASCAVTNGGLKCWGSTPIDVIPPVSSVTAVSGFNPSATYTGGCIAIGGNVRCWSSDNKLFELGNASGSTSLTPVVAIASGGGATDIAAGARHTCAVVGGGVKCWGANDAGQLGAGTPKYSVAPIIAIPASGKAESVVAGDKHSCAVVDGGVKCWGANDQYQLGNGTTTASSAPVTVIAAKSGVTQVLVGRNSTCAVIRGGTKCWGNFSGTPTQGAPELSGITAMARNGRDYILVNGGVKELYGANATFVPPAGGATAVVAGYGHACFIVSGGVQCLGDNTYGQLGVAGSPTNSDSLVSAIPAGSGVTAIAAAMNHTCAAVLGGVKCWGQMSPSPAPFIATPTSFIPAGSNVVAVAAGGDFGQGQNGVGKRLHSCALADGGVYCWGSNDEGELGNVDGFELRSMVPVNRAWIPRPPAQPTIVSAVVNQSGTATVYFVPGYDRGSVVTGYNLTCENLGSQGFGATSTALPNASSFALTGLLPGSFYGCTMTTTTALGSSAPSLQYGFRTPSANPTPPTIASIRVGPGTAIINITPGTSSGYGGLAYYESTCIASGSPTIKSQTTAASTSILVENLIPGIAYQCTVVAWNTGDLPSTASDPVAVTVSATTTTVSLSQPSSGQTFSVPASIVIYATTSAPFSDGINRVDFYAGTTLIGYTVAQPYNWTYTWTAAPQGTHAITAKAYDSMGRVTTSAPVNITVTAGGTGTPTIAITAPANGTTGTPLAITPTITTLGGATIARIDYFADNTLIGSVIDNTSGSNLPASGTPYSWSALAARTYSLTARITDSIGHTATSAPITVTIANVNGETITFLHNDFAGSAIAATDAVGAVLWKENYTPFGDRAVKAVSATGNRQFFTGKPQDSETGLAYFGARYYDPVVGRFMGIDAVGFQQGNLHSFNRYAYGSNNPYRYIDPDGNSILSIGDWISFAKDNGEIWVNHIIYATATINGNADVAQLASDAMQAKVVDAAISTIGIISPAPGSGQAIRAGVQTEIKIGSKVENKLYHYTDQAGAKGIAETGVILPNAKGQVFVTDQKLSAEAAQNRLFLGNTEKGTHVVEISPKGGMPTSAGKNNNELIHQGSIRNGRQADLTVKPNGF